MTARTARLTVSAGLFSSLLAFAGRRGADPQALLALAGVDAATLVDPDSRIALDSHIALMRAAKLATNDPALALHFGAGDDMADFSVVGLLGTAVATMRDALAQLNRYGQLVIEVDLGGRDRFQLDPRADGVWLIDNRENPDDFPELTESTFARMTAGSRRQFGQQSVSRVRVTHPAPPYADVYAAVHQAPVEYDCPRNEVRLVDGWTDMPVALQPRYAFGILARHADMLLAELQATKSLRGRVESLLIPILHSGTISADDIARQIGISRPTLYRRLVAEGTSFERLLDDLRRRMAIDYLTAAKVSVNEVAYLVGYSDAATFTRACKRWTGQAPAALRQSLQSATTPNKSCSSASSMTASTISPALIDAATSRR